MTRSTTIDINWDDVLAHLELLGHRGVGLTKIAAFRAKPKGGHRYIGVFEPALYHSAIDGLRQLHRVDPLLSFFVGSNPLIEEALRYGPNRFILNSAEEPGKADVASIVNVVLDIDPSSERDVTTEEERKAVISAAHDIINTEPLLKEASLIDSGHGTYVIARMPLGTYNWDAVKVLSNELAKRHFSKPNITGKAELELRQLSGYIGLAGGVNTKWDERFWRPRRLLHKGGICNDLAAHLLAWVPPAGVRPGDEIQVVHLGSLDERIAEWCPGYQTLFRTSPGEGKRSDAAFALALKMDRDSWPWGDIETALRMWSQQVFKDPTDTERIERILSDLKEKIPDPAFSKVIPSHKFVRDILGECHCHGGCDVDTAIRLARPSSLSEVPWQGYMRRDGNVLTTVGPSIDAARDDLSHFYDVHLMRTLPHPDITFQSSGAPGIGKTHRMLRKCALIPSAIFTPRREEFAKLVGDLQDELTSQEQTEAERAATLAGVDLKAGRPNIVLITRRELACEEPEGKKTIVGLAKSGHPGLAESRVCSKCPRYSNRFEDCGYYRQFTIQPNTTIIAASAWLRTRRLKDLLYNAKVVILDEDPLDYAFEQLSMSHAQLQQAITFVQHHLPEYATQAEPILEALARATISDQVFAFKNAGIASKVRRIDIAGFNRRYRQVAGTVAAEQLPPVPLTYILAALKQKIRKITQMLVVGKGELVWRRLRTFPGNLPIVVLDATGDERLYRPIFPGRQIEVDEANAQMVAQVWQISDEKLPASSLSEIKMDQVRSIILALHQERNKLGAGGFGVIGRRDILPRLQLPDDILTGHYWGQRGTRTFEGCHTLVILGSAEPDFIDVGLQADLLFGRHLSRDRKQVTRPYYLTSSPGMSWATDVDVYKDSDLQAFYERLREGEMTQAAFRIRPLEGPHKLILVLSSLPLEGLPPTELMTMPELEGRLGLKDPPAAQAVLLAQKRLRNRLGKEPTQKQIATELGVTRSYVGQVLASMKNR